MRRREVIGMIGGTVSSSAFEHLALPPGEPSARRRKVRRVLAQKRRECLLESPVEMPRRYSTGRSASRLFERRAQRGRIESTM